jgi:lipoprotein-anchoring transpeptidase ErfK/SrfK
MVDYVPLLTRAVATLNPNTAEARRVLYDRARTTLVDKLRSDDPGLAHTDLNAERAALEAAIQNVESGIARRAAPPRRVRERRDAPAGYRDMGPLPDPRKRRRAAAGAIAAALVLVVGMAAYMVVPKLLTDARNMTLSDVRALSSNRGAAPSDESSDNKSEYVRMRQLVYYRSNQPAGTIVVDKTQTFLYVVRPNTSALRYNIGLGTECSALSGLYHVARKEEQPSRVLFLDNNDYRIEGFEVTTGRRLSEGCIRLVKDDVNYLYDRTPLESRVVVAN